jgi:spore maturation protein CgeB
MQRKLNLAYFAHTLRSDWNNGNAHFLRGLTRALGQLGHEVTVYEADSEWSIDNLRTESQGEASLERFSAVYSDLDLQTYDQRQTEEQWREQLRGVHLVIFHEWNPPALSQMLLRLRDELGYKLLFHDTHHRASSSPEQMERFGLRRFDGVLAFGEALRKIYRDKFGVERVWTLHEAADTTVFKPIPEIERENRIVWVGNWGDGERSRELCEFLLRPAAILHGIADTTIFGVRYPEDGLAMLQRTGVRYGGYLANLDAPRIYATSKTTVHVPRQQYTQAMHGIPTIRVFEALACGVPLVSAPWEDTEGLFRDGDFLWAEDTIDMAQTLQRLITDRAAAEDQAARGLETVLARHTCAHRAQELTAICEEVLQ